MILIPQTIKSPSPQSAAPRRVVILGSTGSIGCSALKVIRLHPESFQVIGLVAGSNKQLLQQQILEFNPKTAVLSDEKAYTELKASASFKTELQTGLGAIDELVSRQDVDLVLAASSGMIALPAVLSAIRAGKLVILANKETLIVGAELVKKELKLNQDAAIIPIDSEHSALFQLMQGERRQDFERLTLTASGGPFLNTPVEQFKTLTAKEALSHPRWKMGSKITIDSATLVNKALEVIEAHYLFDIPEKQIEVIVHPQSIVHSFLGLRDGTELAQLSVPDMCGAIAYGLNYPFGRLAGVMPKLNLAEVRNLEFLELDQNKFPAVKLARQCLEQGNGALAVFNIANELAVKRFLEGKITFDGIIGLIELALERVVARKFDSLEELGELEREVLRGA